MAKRQTTLVTTFYDHPQTGLKIDSLMVTHEGPSESLKERMYRAVYEWSFQKGSPPMTLGEALQDIPNAFWMQHGIYSIEEGPRAEFDINLDFYIGSSGRMYLPRQEE